MIESGKSCEWTAGLGTKSKPSFAWFPIKAYRPFVLPSSKSSLGEAVIYSPSTTGVYGGISYISDNEMLFDACCSVSKGASTRHWNMVWFLRHPTASARR